MKAFLGSMIKIMAYFTATIIIIAALLVCLTSLLTPILDQHRQDFEQYASQQLKMPVKIKKVQVSWYQYQPVIDLQQVIILDKETALSILKIQKMSLLFSIPKSISQFKLVPNGIILVGAGFNIDQTETGEFRVKGFPALNYLNEQSKPQETTFIDVLAWLSQQPRLIFKNIDLHYTPYQGEKRFVTLSNFNVENTNTTHSVLGKGVLHQTVPTEGIVSLRWEGQIFDLAQIKAKIYIYLSGLSLSQWIHDQSWQGWQIQDGLVSTKIWANWQNGNFQQIQSYLQAYRLKLKSQVDQSVHLINRLSGDFGWKRENQTQVFAGEDILIDLPAHLWPSTNFYISLAPDSHGKLAPLSVNLGYVDLNDIQSFLFSSSTILPDKMQQMLQALQIKGNLLHTTLTFIKPDWKLNALHTHFNQISFSPWQQIPGLYNLSGETAWNGKNGILKINSNKLTFNDHSIFENDIHVNQLVGEIDYQIDENNHWIFRIPTLQILNDAITANAKGSIVLNPNDSPTTDISFDFTLPKATHITHYLPMQLFHPHLVKWLKEAFLSGEVKSGHGVLRGVLKDFPFDHDNGLFSISGDLSNIDFRYAADWPLLREVSGKLTFTGRKMLAEVDHAQILGIPISHVKGVIPYFGNRQPQLLEVQSDDIKADLAQGLNFIHSSPLDKTIGKMFTGITLHGPMNLNLGLSIPINEPVNSKVRGELTVKDAQMNLMPWNLSLDQLNGQVQFTETSTQSKNIQGKLFNKPFQFSLSTLQRTNAQTIVQANFNNSFSISDLETGFNLPLSQVLQGSIDLTGSITFSLREAINIHLQSNLIGASINLMEPYGKNLKEPRNFSVDVIVKNNEPLKMKLSYGNLLRAALILAHQQNKYHLLGANLRLGIGEVTWPPTDGFYISGNLNKLDWTALKKYQIHSNNDSAHFSLAQLKGINLHVDQLDLDSQQLRQVDLRAMKENNFWNVFISSPDVIGQLKIPVKFNRQTLLTAQFQKLKLAAQTNSSQKESLLLDVKNLPAIALVAKEVNYNNMPIGQVIFKAIPRALGWSIQTLRIISPRIDLRASGNWIHERSGNMTFLQGNASSLRVSELINSLGLDAHNFIANKGDINFKLNWQGTPYAPTLAKMSGNASLKLGPGRIVDVGQNAKMNLGRMLSIFSLQTIPRRLTFDFSDVFHQGYSFDSMRGDFKIQNGDLLTNNLNFEGPVAAIKINGRIGLKNKDYNLILSVSAHITSSLPVAATLLTGNPLIGLGAFAVNTMIGSRVSTYYYAVTGPWNNPIWKAVSSPRQ